VTVVAVCETLLADTHGSVLTRATAPNRKGVDAQKLLPMRFV